MKGCKRERKRRKLATFTRNEIRLLVSSTLQRKTPKKNKKK